MSGNVGRVSPRGRRGATPRKTSVRQRVVHGDLDGGGLRVGVVVARFNQYITRQMLELVLDRLTELGVLTENITVVWVPGSVELPVVCKALAANNDAVVALGAVIQGETAHFEHVAAIAAQGLSRASLDTGTPVIFGVLTTYSTAQAVARIGHAAGYAEAAVEMAQVMRSLETR